MEKAHIAKLFGDTTADCNTIDPFDTKEKHFDKTALVLRQCMPLLRKQKTRDGSAQLPSFLLPKCVYKQISPFCESKIYPLAVTSVTALPHGEPCKYTHLLQSAGSLPPAKFDWHCPVVVRICSIDIICICRG